MSDRLWLVPLQPTPGLLRVTRRVLERHTINYRMVDAHQVRARLEHRVPRAALVHGGVVSPLLMDVQRWLGDFQVPTVILAEELGETYESILLDRGAYEVVPLPASPRKLGSRFEAMARILRVPPRHKRVPPRVVVSGEIEIKPAQRSVTVGQTPLSLSKSEFDLLLALALHPGEVLSREQLAQALDRDELTARALESHISRLRGKVRQAGGADFLKAVRGVGYRLAG